LPGLRALVPAAPRTAPDDLREAGAMTERGESRAIRVLVDHQLKDAGSCICGWSQWGASHAEHVWRMLKLLADVHVESKP
jgi:hypothetical protein